MVAFSFQRVLWEACLPRTVSLWLVTSALEILGQQGWCDSHHYGIFASFLLPLPTLHAVFIFPCPSLQMLPVTRTILLSPFWLRKLTKEGNLPGCEEIFQLWLWVYKRHPAAKTNVFAFGGAKRSGSDRECKYFPIGMNAREPLWR